MNNSILAKFFSKRLVQHILFWSFYIFIFTIGLMERRHPLEEPLDIVIIKELIRLGTLMVAVYINLFIFIPKLFDKERYRNFVFFNIILVTGISFFNIFVSEYIMPEKEYTHPNHLRFMWISLHTTMFITISSLIHFTKQWIQLKDISLNIKELEKEKLETELDSLKAQVNPHFLFNTLNNIYSLSLVKSDEAPDVILRLSDLMRYIIYECKDETVALKEEISFLKNYVNLERLRLQEHININFSINIENENKKIAPLLFIPLIENAFKHSNRDTDKAIINISLKENEKDGIKLSIENTKDKNIIDKDNKFSGLGIQNVKKRLELIYPEKHKFNVTDKSEVFTTNMELYI